MQNVKELAKALGIDCKNLPNNLETTVYRAILTKLGYDCSCLPNNLKSTMIKEIGNLLEGGSSGGGVQIVDELPTNPQENVIYETKGYNDVGVIVRTSLGSPDYLTIVVRALNPNSNVFYYVVDDINELSNATESDVVTLSNIYVYINKKNDIAYIYVNLGYGLMWVDIATILTQMDTEGRTYENGGYVEGYSGTIANQNKVYVTYKIMQGLKVNEKTSVVQFEGEDWNDYKKIFDKSIHTFKNNSILDIASHSFVYCRNLIEVDCQNALNIGSIAFYQCSNLKKVIFPKVKYIDSMAFYECLRLTDVFLGEENVVEIYNDNVFSGIPLLIKIHVRPELASQYENTYGWSDLIRDGKVQIIGDYTD